MCDANCSGSSQSLDSQKAEKDAISQADRSTSGVYLEPHPTRRYFPTSSIPSSTPFMPSPGPRQSPPFPSSLTDVPLEYIIETLYTLAPRFWDHAESSDCTIIVPVPYSQECQGYLAPKLLTQILSSHDPTARRATEPNIGVVPRLVMNVHFDYLRFQSHFLRGLFSGASSIDLINSSALSPNASLRTVSGRYTIPHDQLPRLLPASTPQHPVLYLPVPDPNSIQLLFHWMYFGDTSFIHDALVQRTICWEGVARNVEYLGLRSEIKIFLGKFFTKWIRPGHSRGPGQDSDEDDEEGEDDREFDSDSDTVYYGDGDANEEDEGDMAVDLDSDLEPDIVRGALDLKGKGVERRGRDRATRSLS